MSWEAWLTLGVVVAVIAVMVRDLVPPAAAVLSGTVVLLLTNVIDTNQAFAGFSNPAPLTVAALYVLAGAAARTGLVEPLVGATLGDNGGERRRLARLLPPVAASSAVLNNTPIVAVLVPEVSLWASRRGASVSRYLMPISFAAILGGVVTLIGTSTNLVVSGLLEAAGDEPLGFFEITGVGLPAALLGVGLVVWLTPITLPDRRSARQDLTEESREFVVDMEVDPAGKLVGSTVESGGLRHLSGVFLVQAERDAEIIAPVTPDLTLRGRDRLRFVGRVDDIVDLHSLAGLVSSQQDQFTEFDLSRSSFFEVVIGDTSPLIGTTLKAARFRSQYQAAVVAIHRSGHRIDAKLGEVALRVGDTLLVVADPDFRARWRDRRDFLLISPLAQVAVPDTGKRWLVGAIAAGMVTAAALGVLPILEAALLAVLAVLGLRILTPGEARNSIDLDVVLLMAGGFGLAAAMETSGLAEQIARGIISSLGGLGTVGALLGVVLATVLLTELVSNTAAALIVFPIAAATAAGIGADVRGFAVAVAVAASASFLTPVGYQTNTMVYGPGGYRYTDYARLGAPLTLLVVATILFTVPAFWSL